MKKVRVAIIGGASVLLLAGLMVALLLPRPVQAQGTAGTALTSGTCDCSESSFGDLAADAVRSAGNADIGLLPAISFRPGTIPPGPITADRVGGLLANPTEVWAVSRLTGAQVKGALEHAVRAAPLPNNSFLQVSGIAFTYSQSGERDQRVTSVTVGGAPLSDSATYTVAMPLSLAKGGSGFFKVFTKDAIVTTGATSLAQAIVAYAQVQGTVSYTGTGRITAQ
ncbi:MAG: 5'-nucleotidase C-terminal domain-containing protein [Bacteroidota bacterium]